MGHHTVQPNLFEVWPFRQYQPHVRALGPELEIQSGTLLACPYAAAHSFVSRPRSISTRWITKGLPFLPSQLQMPEMTAESSTHTLLSRPQLEPARVSVVIVVWNAKKYVLECLGSLREHCRKVCAQVVIVDNASTDGTPELVAEIFPEFKLIRNAENFGFAKANNIGIAESSGDYICLVNSDVKFLDD